MQAHQTDLLLETAYVQGRLDDKIYMAQLEMFVHPNQPEKVYRQTIVWTKTSRQTMARGNRPIFDNHEQ